MNGENMAKTKKNNNEPIEKQLWKSADKLRKNIDAAEYKHVVLGLIFLKYISDAFEELHSKLKSGKGEYAGADPEDKDEYKAENVFFVPEIARWSYLQSKAKLPTIGKEVDNAMDAIEKENPSLKDVLPKVYARGNLDPTSLGGLIDLIANIALGDAKARSADILGHVFEYFLGEFALAEGKKGGQFYTPRSVVELLVEMLEPYKGRVFDPCCGSGGMFVQSEKFVQSHRGKVNDISIYGQESNQTTWRLCKMNLAIRGIDSSQVKWNNEGSFLNDAHKDLKADFVIANPPFNDSDWSGDLLRNDGRWKYGIPPAGSANYAWIQHFLYHLSPSGVAGFVLAKGSLTSKSSGEGDIRKALIEARLVDCIVNLPAKLFLNTQIPACLWFIRRSRAEPSPQPSPKGRGGEEVQYRGNFYFSGLVETARKLRENSTPAESVMWELLRDRQFMNLKFRRQHQIGDYIVDFYCAEERLIIELDGAVHESERRKKIDHKRDAYLKSIGNKVLRISNEILLSDPEAVLRSIADNINSQRQSEVRSENPLNPNSLPEGEGRVRGTISRSNEILFIDARNEGVLINRRTRVLREEDIQKIAQTYHAWRNTMPSSPSTSGRGARGEGVLYEDVKGFCCSASIERVKELDYVLTPGRYVGLPDEEDDFDFNERFTSLKAEFEEQLKEEARLNRAILENLKKVKPL
jgi:type I restriction enzyme M protein